LLQSIDLMVPLRLLAAILSCACLDFLGYWVLSSVLGDIIIIYNSGAISIMVPLKAFNIHFLMCMCAMEYFKIIQVSSYQVVSYRR
jgi:hypothetical protein